MAVLHDYYCETHGIFEAWEAKCPMKHCSATISKVFLKPVGMKSDKTKATDKNMKNLALDFGMTDIKKTHEGEHQTGYLKRNNKLTDKQFAEATEAMAHNNQMQMNQPRPGDSVIWGGGGNINMKSVMGGQFKSVAGESVGINPREAGPMRGPTPGVVMNDHENLQVK
jgi:hypothetical protein